MTVFPFVANKTSRKPFPTKIFIFNIFFLFVAMTETGFLMFLANKTLKRPSWRRKIRKNREKKLVGNGFLDVFVAKTCFRHVCKCTLRLKWKVQKLGETVRPACRFCQLERACFINCMQVKHIVFI